MHCLGVSQNPYSKSFNRDYWYKECYGTHDWIADAAVEAILADTVAKGKWESEECETFWTERRKIIFFIGTEAPDAGHDKINIQLNGRRVTGLRTLTHQYFYPQNSELDNRMRFKKMYSFYYSCLIWSDLAALYLSQGKTDLAAFYMGAVSHIIADMATFAHVITLGEKEHSNFEDAVLYETRIPQGEFFFSYPKKFTILSIDPAWSVLFVAFDTRWDYQINPLEFYTEPYPESVQPGTNKAETLKDEYLSWDSDTQDVVEKWVFWFKLAIQKHINNAVKYTAYALNFFADFWNGKSETSCDDCDGDSGAENFPPDGDARGLARAIRDAMTIIVVIALANSLGIPVLLLASRMLTKFA
jgi:hypothetical protein